MKYVLKEDRFDQRDFKFSSVIAPVAKLKLPKMVDLRTKMPPVYNQGALGSCTANAGCAYLSYLYKKPFMNFSRLYLYYKERFLEGTIGTDNGASMRSIAMAMNKFGVCLEEFMPYIESNFAKTPSDKANKNAEKYKIKSYHSLNNLEEIKQCLAISGQPVLLGMRVYKSFEEEFTAKSGKMKNPTPNDTYLGNHAVLVTGYNEKQLIVRNSWGEKWGDNGYFYMPYDYFLNYTFNYWTLF